LKYLQEEEFNKRVFAILLQSCPRHYVQDSKTIIGKCLVIRNPQIQEECLHQCLVHYGDLIPQYLKDIVVSQSNAQQDKALTRGLQYLQRMEVPINFSLLLNQLIDNLDNMKKIPHLVRYLVQQVESGIVQQQALVKWFLYGIQNSDSHFLQELERKFGSEVFWKPRRWERTMTEMDILEYAHTRRKCDLLAFLLKRIPVHQRKERLLNELTRFSQVRSYRECHQQLKTILSEIETYQAMLQFRRRYKATQQNPRQQGAKQAVTILMSYLHEIYDVYKTKKDTVKDPIRSAYQYVRKNNPNNPFVKKTKKRPPFRPEQLQAFFKKIQSSQQQDLCMAQFLPQVVNMPEALFRDLCHDYLDIPADFSIRQQQGKTV
jgi:hypothetical protein